MTASRAYLSTGAFGRMPVTDILEVCRSHGIRRLELSSAANYTASMQPALEAAAASGELEFVVHNYFPTPAEPFVLNLAAERPELARRSLEHCREAIELCVGLGSAVYSFHAGFAFDPAPQDLGAEQAHLPRVCLDAALERFIGNVRLLADFASQHGVALLIENNVVAPANVVDGGNHMYLGVTGEDMVELVRRTDRENVGILLDVGHLKVSAQSLGFDAEAAVRVMGPHIQGVHLSDNDGRVDSNRPVTADAWFWPVLEEVLPTDPLWVIEVYGIAAADACAQLDLVGAR